MDVDAAMAGAGALCDGTLADDAGKPAVWAQ